MIPVQRLTLFGCRCEFDAVSDVMLWPAAFVLAVVAVTACWALSPPLDELEFCAD